jgi:hypothetical protein
MGIRRIAIYSMFCSHLAEFRFSFKLYEHPNLTDTGGRCCSMSLFDISLSGSISVLICSMALRDDQKSWSEPTGQTSYYTRPTQRIHSRAEYVRDPRRKKYCSFTANTGLHSPIRANVSFDEPRYHSRYVVPLMQVHYLYLRLPCDESTP